MEVNHRALFVNSTHLTPESLNAPPGSVIASGSRSSFRRAGMLRATRAQFRCPLANHGRCREKGKAGGNGPQTVFSGSGKTVRGSGAAAANRPLRRGATAMGFFRRESGLSARSGKGRSAWAKKAASPLFGKTDDAAGHACARSAGRLRLEIIRLGVDDHGTAENRFGAV